MDSTQPQKQPEPPGERLLLSSLAEFWSLIEPLLLAARPATVCEVGIGKGEFTALLLEFCQKNSCRYSGVDSRVNGSAMQRDNAAPAEFYQGSSLSVLPTLAPQDVYFIDGDHNYYTVSHELKLILKTPDRWPLIFLHDICWPWGRRDQYCSPESIPEEFRHPHSAKQGVAPGRSELGPGGFTGEASAYLYSAAAHEGGPRNGVLTAVEDFVREQPENEWRLVIVPVVFGLGIMYAPARCSKGVRQLLEQLANSILPLTPLFESLERNRIDLFMTYLRNVTELVSIHGDYKALAEYDAAMEAQYDRLLHRRNAFQRACDKLATLVRPAP